MNDKELYDECHRLFSYCPASGKLIRRIPVLNRHGGIHNMPNTKAGDTPGNVDSRGYSRVLIGSKRYFIHRIIWLMQTGEFPKEYIDHINCIKTDNRWANLREASHADNQHNRGKQHNNTTGYKGVLRNRSNNKNPYLAKIGLNGKYIFIGNFPTPELAHEAYCKKAIELHGEFGRAA